MLKDLDGKRKITVKEVQVLTGYLNFLSRAIFAGKAFTRRIYSKFATLTGENSYSSGGTKVLKPFHHVKIDAEMRFDCEVWKVLLENYRDLTVCRPMIDGGMTVTAYDLGFYSDASAKETFGFRAVFKDRYCISAQWDPRFIKDKSPSIEYLELYGLAAGILTWGQFMQNTRI